MGVCGCDDVSHLATDGTKMFAYLIVELRHLRLYRYLFFWHELVHLKIKKFSGQAPKILLHCDRFRTYRFK